MVAVVAVEVAARRGGGWCRDHTGTQQKKGKVREKNDRISISAVNVFMESVESRCRGGLFSMGVG